jgi:hypothetical protein
MVWILLFLLSFSSFAASINNMVPATIYGTDDREEVVFTDHLDRSRPVAVALHNRFSWQLPKVKSASLKERLRVCPDDRFADQPSIAVCTGVHIGGGVILTARHCMKTALDCERYRWAFNYRTDVVGDKSGEFNLENTYRCEKILLSDEKLDLSLVQLEKTASTEATQKLTASAPVTTHIYALGSPVGLPLKYSGLGLSKEGEEHFILASLDVFQGNSGSPIFNDRDEMLGVLIAGEKDFTVNAQNNCRETLVVDESRQEEKVILLRALTEEFWRHIADAQKNL